METQGGGRGSEKWGDNSNNIVAGGGVGGRQQQDLRQQQGAYQAQERRHPTPDKRNASPLVGGAEPIVTELEHDDNSCQKKDQAYSVKSPVTSTEIMDVIPTPPAIDEVQTRSSKRTTGINMEHLGVRAEKMAKKRNLQESL
ncbi:hypothetical protein D1007_15028 [Hordeum vulgare]|nr:hypothetical protein D1007_15028 [Hordeum vulgare]